MTTIISSSQPNVGENIVTMLINEARQAREISRLSRIAERKKQAEECVRQFGLLLGMPPNKITGIDLTEEVINGDRVWCVSHKGLMCVADHNGSFSVVYDCHICGEKSESYPFRSRAGLADELLKIEEKFYDQHNCIFGHKCHEYSEPSQEPERQTPDYAKVFEVISKFVAEIKGINGA